VRMAAVSPSDGATGVMLVAGAVVRAHAPSNAIDIKVPWRISREVKRIGSLV